MTSFLLRLAALLLMIASCYLFNFTSQQHGAYGVLLTAYLCLTFGTQSWKTDEEVAEEAAKLRSSSST